MPKPWENKSGCADPTAYEACKATPEEIRVGKLVKAIKAVSVLAEALVRANMPEWCGQKITTMAQLENAVAV